MAKYMCQMRSSSVYAYDIHVAPAERVTEDVMQFNRQQVHWHAFELVTDKETFSHRIAVVISASAHALSAAKQLNQLDRFGSWSKPFWFGRLALNNRT